MGAPLELIQELDSSITHSTDQRRSVMLRHLTDLYLVGSEQYSEDEIDLIDDVFVRLVSTIEQSARALHAIRLGPVMVGAGRRLWPGPGRRRAGPAARSRTDDRLQQARLRRLELDLLERGRSS